MIMQCVHREETKRSKKGVLDPLGDGLSRQNTSMGAWDLGSNDYYDTT